MPSRRDLLRLAAGASVAAAQVIPLRAHSQRAASPAQPVSPNDRIQLALIGAGGQGTYDTNVALRVPGVELVAAADVYDGRLARAKEVWGASVFTSRDYREVLARNDVDAVIIATPDHWHQRIAIDAIKAGKDVYIEKPMVQHAEEGPALVAAAATHARIVQVGSQRVSSIVYEKARQLIKGGALGTLTLVEAFINRNTPLGAWQYSIPPDASPQTVDWDRFLGHAPKRPFEPVRLFRWRNYRDYGTGVAGDLFVHLLSGIHYVLDSLGPTRILATGGLRVWKDGRDAPDVMLALLDYPATASHPAFNLALKVNFAAGSGESSQFDFVGEEATVRIDGPTVRVFRRAKLSEPGYTVDTFPAAIQKQFLQEYRRKYPGSSAQMGGPEAEEAYVAPRGYSDSYDHFVNFFTGVRTRAPVVEDAAFGLRAAAPSVLTNVSHFDGRIVKWDPQAMRVSAPEKPSPSSGL
jgi:predicted dehydrogenase